MSKKFTVINSPLYYDEDITNYATVNATDIDLSETQYLEITTRHGEFKFEAVTDIGVPSNTIGLNSRQRTRDRLKLYHTYYVKPSVKQSSLHSIVDLFDQKYNFRAKVGGSDTVFEKIFGEALLARFYPKNFVQRTNMKHAKGILLYGVSGTGKTLIARTVSEILGVLPKVINGPEILSKMLGDSEAKIRQLFDEAKSDPNGDLHLLIFDEIDAVCKRRSVDEANVRDSVENSITSQLLCEMDGLHQLNNLLIIATTNRPSAIDPALLRPGRLEIHVKIELPNDEARLNIFDIYAKPLLQNNLLHHDVNFDRIIQETQGWTEAHIERLVRTANVCAMKRDLVARGTLKIDESAADALMVSDVDFIAAINVIRSISLSL
ncbi:unnamed protein product [Didymodactylos carnosus]|uniref:Vesicle-fusing ATPase n=1 Tax=Didymodactylos carnosus TaxID=1234261 RepID=A0A815N624_9BILA|nr:unnamed protein product [Didymodactylos carnosus]CAF4306259.1 unnamed protein product [Didymodactylos carnosus]